MNISRVLFILVLAAACFAQSRDNDFNKLADRVFDELIFHYDPASATQAGFHQYDALMPTLSRSEIDEDIAATRKFIAEVDAFDPQGLSPWSAADCELMRSQLHSQLLALDSIRMWEKNPDNYTSYATSAIFVIMSRNFAPAH